MKKILKFFTLFLSLLLASCSSSFNVDNLDENIINYNELKGEIGDFSLIELENKEVTSVPTFSWTEASNASSYTLEVASSTAFKQSDDTVYVKKTGIIDTHFDISASIKNKDTTYYYRVTAVNKDHTKLCSNLYSSFYLKASNNEEIEFNIDYADEWTVHKEGSQADISIDKSNFFNNGKNALVIDFDKEKTNQGISSSDGWIVVTHQQEEEMYGVDAFYFNFYYSGDNTNVYLRVVDEDNEYYNAQIKVANNVKQTVIMKFSDFTLRTKGGTTIANQVFDYNYIKYVELVFEQTFGDGTCLISNLKAVNYANYSYMFFKKIDFAKINEDSIIKDNYNFIDTIDSENNTFTMSYGGDINGYGFSKIPIEKSMISGDALKLNLEFTGSSSTRILIRLIEEDKDRWVYRQYCSTLPSDGTIIIPYNAFTLSEYNGDGSRQFYYLRQIQIGVENTYSAGSIKINDIEIVTLDEEIDNLYVDDLASSPLIDNFEEYVNSTEVYYKWQISTDNKDEQMLLDKSFAFGNDNTCLRVGYKSDMYPAYYGKVIKNSPSDYHSLSFSAYDTSAKNSEVVFNYLDSVSAKMIVSLFVDTGEEYRYVIDSLNKYRTKYTIAFSDFELADVATSETSPLVSEKVTGVKFGLQYYYYKEDGSSYPVYANNNFVYFDDFKFSKDEVSSVTELAKKVVPSVENANVAYVDQFDYADTDELLNYWTINSSDKAMDYSSLSLEAGAMKMHYKGNSDSVSYGYQTLITSDVKAKGISIDLKGDDKATVYINLYATIASINFKYRATISNVKSSWNTYRIGFDSTNFVKVEGTGSMTLSNKYVSSIYKITFGIVNTTNNLESDVYVDNIFFDYDMSYSTNTVSEVN